MAIFNSYKNPSLLMLFIVITCVNMIQAQVETRNGWDWVNPNPFGGDFNCIEVVDAAIIFAGANYGTIMRSNDGGKTWSQVDTPPGFTDNITDIEFFSDKLNGFAIGGGKLLETVNGGDDWAVNTDLNNHIFQSYTSSPTLEFQTSWTDTTITLNSVFFINTTTGWAAGEDGTILVTNNEGNTWTPQTSGINETILEIQFVNDKVGWAVGIHGTILRTTDAGATWVRQASSIANLLFASHFYDENIGWVVGVNQKILKTTDAGITWNQQTAPTTNRNLQSVHFIDDLTGWIAGDNNVLLKTTDGGEYWYDRSPSLGMNFQSVYFSDELNGWGTGENGRILRSTDGGDSWEDQDIRTGKDLESVTFVNSSQGWTVGSTGAFFRTIDSGVYWSEFETGINERLNSVYFPIPDKGWMVGERGRILTFYFKKIYSPVSAADNYILGLSERNNEIFVSLMAGLNSFADVSNVVAVKTNPAAPWAQATIMPKGNLKLHGFDYPYQWGIVAQYGRGYIFEEDQISVFTDGRIKDISLIPGTDDFLFINDSMLHKNTISNALGYVGANPQTVHAINESVYYTAGDSIYRTIDAGITLENLGNAGVDINDLDFLNEVVGFGAGDSGRIIATNTSGNLWSPTLDPVSIADHITNVYFKETDNQTGYIQTSNTRPTMTYKSTNGGRIWEIFNEVDTTFFNIDKFYVTPNEKITYILDEDDSLYMIEADTIKSTQMYVRDFTFINNTDGWYIDSTTIYKITAGDTAWVMQKEFENYPVFNTVFFKDRFLGIIAGNYGKILKTTDGGDTWRDISVAGEHVKGVYFRTADFGYVGDVNGGFYSTTDGGTTWTERVTNSTGEINFIYFFDRYKGFAVTEEGILITTNGGINLQLYDSPLYEETGNEQKTPSIYGKELNPNFLIYARGKNILVADDVLKGEITSASVDNLTDFIPQDFELIQNFPNPFNAQTTIMYNLPKAVHVSLKIYDLLGRQISIMENSVKEAGIYKVTFDASEVASGIYFYRIEAGNWYDIKKMILLK